MATFHLDLGGGDVVEVRADTEAEAIEIAREKGPTLLRVVAYTEDDNGRILKDPKGREYFVSKGYSTSDPERIAEAKKGAQPADLASDMFHRAVLDEHPVASWMATAAAPTFLGAGSFIDEALDATVGGQSGASIRAMQNATADQNPLTNLATQAGVSAVGAYGLAKQFPQVAAALGSSRGRPLASQVLKGATVGGLAGATEGGIMGAGMAEEGERLQGAKSGALWGGVVGAPVGAAAPVVGAGLRNVADYVKNTDLKIIASAFGISQNAARVIKQAFTRGGSIDDARAMLERAGQQGMVADAGQAAQALLDASATGSPQAGGDIADALGRRSAATSTSLNRTLDDTLGDAPIGPEEATRRISARTRDARGQAYDQAYGQRIDYGSEAGSTLQGVVDRIPKRVMREAVEEANEDMVVEGIENLQIEVVIGPDGSAKLAVDNAQLNVQQLDYLKRALSTLSENARGEFGKQTAKSRRYGKLASELRAALGGAVEGYDNAVRLGGDTIAEQNAFKLGRDALKAGTHLEDVIEELGVDPSTAQIEAARLGMMQYIRDMLGNVKAVPSDPNIEARQLNEFLKLTSSDNARKKIVKLMGGEADALLKEMDKVSQTALVRTSVSVNSKTNQRGVIQDSVNELIQPGVIGQAARGKVAASTAKIVQAITGMTDEYTEGVRLGIYEDIAKALTQKQGRTARIALDELERAMSGGVRSAEQNERLAQLLAAAFYGGAEQGGRVAAQD